ncbi:extracellular solute-binding protein, partial [bacterium]|nr:extracellular solute-binding protein [bacterium]
MDIEIKRDFFEKEFGIPNLWLFSFSFSDTKKAMLIRPNLLALIFLFSFLTFQVESVELVFWNFWDPKFILPVIAKFEETHPGVSIKNEQLTWGNGLDKIVVAIANGRTPDICELGSTWTGKFMSGESLIDITGFVQDIFPEYLLWEPATWNHRIYGVPWLVGTRVLFFNRSLFKNVDLDPEKPPTTWDELLNAAKKIHRPEMGVYGFGVNAGEGHILYKKFLPFVWGNGGSILDASDNFVFDSLATREALAFYQKLMQFGLKEKQDILDDAFKRGKLGLEISGSWNFAKFPKESPDLDFGVTLIPKPAPDKGHSSSFLGGEILVLFKNCKAPSVAVDFIKFLTRAENSLPITKEALVSFPANRKAFSDPFFSADPRLAVFVKQMETAVHPPIHPLWIELENIINDTVEKILYGGDIDSALKNAAVAYEKVKVQRVARLEPSGNLASKPSDSSSKFSESESWILHFIAFGTLINALILLLIYV